MAWQCSGSNSKELLFNLQKVGIIKSESTLRAMTYVDRERYTSRNPFQDSPQSIGSNATISAPHMHAHCLELLNISPGDKVLDIGCGSGYLTSCFSYLSGSEGFVVGMDHISELVEKSKKNIESDHPELLNQIFFQGTCCENN